jgi:hypothetical protein
MSLSKLLKTSDSIAVERMQLLLRHVPPVVLNAWIENMYKLNLVNKLLLDEASNPLKDAIFNEAFPPNNPWNRKRRGCDLADSRRKRNRGYALNEMKELTDSQFIRMFRLSRPAFYSLLSLITPYIQCRHNGIAEKRNEEFAITPETKLAITLRWLAGGSYLDICFAFGVCYKYFHCDNGPLWQTMRAIDKCLQLGFPLHDEEKLEEISEGFSKFCHGRVKGCVMAVDGWVCETRKPYDAETQNVVCFRNRKGFFGMVCLAGCDHKTRFMMMSANFPGSTNDSLAWVISKIYTDIISDNLLQEKYFFISDEAISSTEQILSPFGGRGIGVWRDSFNYHLSAMRQCIERAFGILTRRWGIFWRPLTCAMDKWSLVIMVCAKLHNFCIDHNMPDETATMSYDFAEGQDDAQTFFSKCNVADDDVERFNRNDDNCSQKRLNITHYLKLNGCMRPMHSSNNKA